MILTDNFNSFSGAAGFQWNSPWDTANDDGVYYYLGSSRIQYSYRLI